MTRLLTRSLDCMIVWRHARFIDCSAASLYRLADAALRPGLHIVMKYGRVAMRWFRRRGCTAMQAVFGCYSAVAAADAEAVHGLAEKLPYFFKQRSWQSGAYQVGFLLQCSSVLNLQHLCSRLLQFF